MLYIRYALWAGAVGALIPVMAVLNARLGRVLAVPNHAAVILFAVGLATAVLVSLLSTGRLPSITALRGAQWADFAGGAIVAAYVLSITFLAPRFGVGNAILFAVCAQVITSALIDHFGLLGAQIRPVSSLRSAGLIVMLLGLSLSQYSR
jgi:transporter family-2 protein